MKKPNFEFHIVEDAVNDQCFVEERQGLFQRMQKICMSNGQPLTFSCREEAIHWVEHEIARRVDAKISIHHM